VQREARKVAFEYPDIHQRCPVCQGPFCAQWKGYYTRLLNDIGSRFLGYIAIRYGRCRREREIFSYLPDFLLPYRRLSKMSLVALIEGWKKHGRMRAAIDEVCNGVPEQFDIALSTAYSYFEYGARVLRLNGLDRKLNLFIGRLMEFLLRNDPAETGFWFSGNLAWQPPVRRRRKSSARRYRC
jgi:hypothetical protein